MSVLVDIKKSFKNFSLDLSFEAFDGTLALLGASGCGKSLTLKCIAGVERPDSGHISVDGESLFDFEKKIDLPPQARGAGLLFQSYALFPNMTVLQNIRAGARREKDASLRRKRVDAVMEAFGLSPFADSFPAKLSGGQQQRAALARILVSDPRLLLLDEPFSALDSHLRFRLEQELREVIRDFGKTVILVSHDRDEVYRLSDRIAIMNSGRIEAVGDKKEIFSHPKTVAGAVLTGCKNISSVKPIGPGRVFASDWGLELAVPPGGESSACIGIRMHDLCPGGGPNSFSFRVMKEIENPFSCTLMLAPEGANAPSLIGWELDKLLWRSLRAERLYVSLPPEAILLLEE